MVTTMLKTLAQVDASDLPAIGGKAYNCAVLRQAGLPVPDGLVVPVDAAESELHEIDRDRWFDNQPTDARYAVRSSGIGEDSAGHSFAGIHETQLNVRRSELVEAVVVCRRSSESRQARAYRENRHLDDENETLIGVLVQRMVDAVVSGVAFTMNPVTGADELVVNAGWGLGEALVSGQITPDEFIVDKQDRRVQSSRPSAQNGDAGRITLTPARLAELAELLLRIESHYGAPQDVEWCHDGRQFWIVQSRPITTDARLKASRSAPSGGAEIEWTRANLAEVLPEQLAPQVLDSYETMLNRGQRMFMGRLLAPDAELGPMFKSFHGRLYMNLSQMRRVVAMSGAPAADMLRSLGHPGEIRPEDETPKPLPLREFLRCLPDFVRIGSYDLRAARLLRRHEAATQTAIRRLKAEPSSLSDREIWETLHEWVDAAPQAIQIVFVMSAVLFRESSIRKACNAVGFPYERLVYPQLAAGQRSVSSQQAIDLVALADAARRDARAAAYLLRNDGRFADWREALAGTSFLDRFDRFLDRYGHRGRYESDWSLPRLHEDPSPALFAIREQLNAPPQDARGVAERQEADAAAAWRAFEARLSPWQKWTLAPRIRSMLKRLKKQYVWREQVRSDLTRVLRFGRRYHLTLADRFVERGWIDRRSDYFLLHLDEIGAVVRGIQPGASLRPIAAARAAELAAQKPLQLPMLMRESELPRLMRRGGDRPFSPADSGDLTGLCVSPGSVEADVVVLHDPGEFARMRRGAILVTRATDPSWTPLFTLASGVIVEVGGMLSHASTIAREYGLPALANVKDATRRLRTGERVRLDASGGRVERLEAQD